MEIFYRQPIKDFYIGCIGIMTTITDIEQFENMLYFLFIESLSECGGDNSECHLQQTSLVKKL